MNQKLVMLFFVAVFLLPILWYVPGTIIGKGDCYPFSYNLDGINSDLESWSSNNLGSPSPSPSLAIIGLFFNALTLSGLDVGFSQIVYLSFCFLTAAFSTFYLGGIIFTKKDLARVIASFFYIANFFLFNIITNIGMMWTYAWIPLLMALLAKILTRTGNTARNCLFFACLFSIVASVASVNLANVVLIVISLGCIFVYYTFFDRKLPYKRLIKISAILLAITALLSVWWIFPTLYYYLPSDSSQLQQDINVQSWSWTHQRASLLNLASLNAGWNWRPEYTPYYQIYAENVVFSALMLAPLILACLALILKRDKIITYFLFTVLFFLFLAKGLHEPLSFVNLLLYNSVPFMEMFREPVTKFTLVSLPFLSLLIGVTVNQIISSLSRVRKFAKRPHIYRSIFTSIFVIILIIPIAPLVTNPLETKTTQIPYSSYVQLPQYWIQASQWLGSQKGDFRVLFTAPNDYYQVPYVWGYYGTDNFLEKQIDKPVVSATCLYSYKTNQNATELIADLDRIIEEHQSTEFKSFLELFNVKYVLQRNDLDYNYLDSTGRYIISTDKMKAFLTNQTCLTLVKQFGALDIYQNINYSNPVRLTPIQNNSLYNPEVIEHVDSKLFWAFGSLEQFKQWNKMTVPKQFGSECLLSLDNGTLMFEIMNSTWGWKTLNSPLIQIDDGTSYTLTLRAKGENTFSPHVKIFEYNKNAELISAQQYPLPVDKTSEWIQFKIDDYKAPKNTAYLQVQIWSGHESNTPLPNRIWIDDLIISGSKAKLNPEISQVLESSGNLQQTKIVSYERLSATRMIVMVNTSQPSLLVISEAYDKNWEATIDGTTVQSISFLTLNSFNITRTGLITINVEYKPQQWLYYGLAVSVLSFFFLLMYVKYKVTSRKEAQ